MPVVNCVICMSTFPARTSQGKYCSDGCRQTAHTRRNRFYREHQLGQRLVRRCVECGSPFTARTSEIACRKCRAARKTLLARERSRRNRGDGAALPPAYPRPKLSPQAGTGYAKPPKHTQWKPGQSGNPKGRPSVGAVLKEWLQRLAALSVGDVRAISTDDSAPIAKRAAAVLWLRAIDASAPEHETVVAHLRALVQNAADRKTEKDWDARWFEAQALIGALQ